MRVHPCHDHFERAAGIEYIPQVTKGLLTTSAQRAICLVQVLDGGEKADLKVVELPARNTTARKDVGGDFGGWPVIRVCSGQDFFKSPLFHEFSKGKAS